jgi:hypothetical protein
MIGPRALAVALTLAGLAGCGNQVGLRDEVTAVQSVASALSVQAQRARQDGPGPDTSVITAGTPAEVRQVIAPLEGRLKSIIVLKTNESTVLFHGGANGPYEYWLTPSGQSFTLQGGVLVATRGMNFDLMSASADGSAALIRAKTPGETRKTMRFLDGLDDEVALEGTCAIGRVGPETVTLPTGAQHTTTRMRETCVYGPLTVTNTFWVDDQGRVAQSRQWGSAETGELFIQDLRN